MSEKNTREQIVDAADLLVYQQGFEHTSFSDIAGSVGISRGNFYYHFRTKDEILAAVIERRMENTRAMLETWVREHDDPVDRIRSFVNILILNRGHIKQYGCPVGTLTSELAKLNHHSLADANKVFSLFRNWLRKQFTAMGRKQDADELAMHVLAFSQGVATLANAFPSDKFIRFEVEMMDAWLTALSNEAGARQ